MKNLTVIVLAIILFSCSRKVSPIYSKPANGYKWNPIDPSYTCVLTLPDTIVAIRAIGAIAIDTASRHVYVYYDKKWNKIPNIN